MKKLNLLLLSLAVVLLGIGTSAFKNSESNLKGCIKGSGNVTSVERKLNGFKSIETKGGFEVIIKKSNDFNVSIEADDNLLDNIITEVIGGKLIIRNEKSICNAKELKITLSMPELVGLNCSGASEVITLDKFTSEKFELKCSGASELDLNIDTKLLVSKLNGASELRLKGSADTHAIEMSGASEVKALDFKTQKYAIETKGASSCKISVSEELSVKASGASEIKYSGSPKIISKDVSGASDISAIK